MKQLVSSNGHKFGPYTDIAKEESQYNCDGWIFLPFEVVGDDAVIGDWVEPVTEEQPTE